MNVPRGVKMPPNNRVSSSVSLKMNDIWTKTIGYDPYSAGNELNDEEEKQRSAGLLLLAKMSNLSGSETRGACQRCGMIGHLTFQCRNTPKTEQSPSDSSSDEEKVESNLKKRKVEEDESDSKRRVRDRKVRKESKRKSKKSKKKSKKSDK